MSPEVVYMEDLRKWLMLLTVMGSAIVFLWNGWQYLDKRKSELSDKRFEVYHRLIKELVEPPTPDGKTYLDRQIAVAFELRSFPEYAEVTQRILSGLRESWGSDSKNTRLITEIDLTMMRLEKSSPRKNH
jgi:hypothetical protein